MVYTATDREQIEELKKWWNDYGKSIAIAVMIGLCIGFVWRYWHAYVTAKETAASEIYQSMGQAALSNQKGVVEQDALQLQQQYSKTVYASLGAFLQARTAIEQGHYIDADAALMWIIHHSDQASYQQIARIRDARVWLELAKPDRAKAVIATVTDKAYQPMIDEVNGEIDVTTGKRAQAIEAWQTAKAGYGVAGMSNPLLDLRLAN